MSPAKLVRVLIAPFSVASAMMTRDVQRRGSVVHTKIRRVCSVLKNVAYVATLDPFSKVREEMFRNPPIPNNRF